MDAHQVPFPQALQVLRKSASRIVASRHLVKKSLYRSRCTLRQYSSQPPRGRVNSSLAFFTYALSMDYVLGLDGGGTKTECVLMDPAGKILARSFSGPSNPWRVGVESATREIEKAADLSFAEAQVARNVIVALGAGLAGTGNPELEERKESSLSGAVPRGAVRLFSDFGIALPARAERAG